MRKHNEKHQRQNNQDDARGMVTGTRTQERGTGTRPDDHPRGNRIRNAQLARGRGEKVKLYASQEIIGQIEAAGVSWSFGVANGYASQDFFLERPPTRLVFSIQNTGKHTRVMADDKELYRFFSTVGENKAIMFAIVWNVIRYEVESFKVEEIKP